MTSENKVKELIKLYFEYNQLGDEILSMLNKQVELQREINNLKFLIDTKSALREPMKTKIKLLEESNEV